MSEKSKTVLAIAAHPDDIEILMTGTLLALKEVGYQIHYLNVANGCCGSTTLDRKEIAEIREREAKEACQKLGATFHPSLCDDLSIFYEPKTLAAISSTVRVAAPDIVLTHALDDYMEDHMNTARLAVTACFSRGMPNFMTQPEVPVISKPIAVYHAQPYFHVDQYGKERRPSLFVDVTNYREEKLNLLSCHSSQKKWLDETQGIDSYLDTMLQLDRQAGLWSGQFHSAEGWTQHSHLGLGPEAWDPLQSALGKHCVIR